MPTKQQVAQGTYRLVGGQWHKRCAGPAHEEPVYLPATDKYFYVRGKRSGNRVGQLMHRCRLCNAWEKVKSPGSNHGLVPAIGVRHVYHEAVNRVGVMELSRRTGLTPEGIVRVLQGRVTNVRKANLRLVMLELISMRRKNEHSINGWAAWRLATRAAPSGETCSGCGTPLDNFTEDCKLCQDRQRKRRSRD